MALFQVTVTFEVAVISQLYVSLLCLSIGFEQRGRNVPPPTQEYRQIVNLMRKQDIKGAMSAICAHIEIGRQGIMGTMTAVE